MSSAEINKFVKKLRDYKGRIPAQQLRTLRGQALTGDLTGAKKGLTRLVQSEQHDQNVKISVKKL